MYYNKYYLQHHGILGQHWGDRNGPPYPLDSSDHSSSEKKAGWTQSLKSKIIGNKTEKAENKADTGRTTKKEDTNNTNDKQDKKDNLNNQNSEINKIEKSFKIGTKGSDLSEDQLKQAIDRMNLEKTYNELLRSTGRTKETNTKGREFVNKIITRSAENIGTQLTTYAMGTLVNAAYNKYANKGKAKINLSGWSTDDIKKEIDRKKTIQEYNSIFGVNSTTTQIVNPKKGQKDK